MKKSRIFLATSAFVLAIVGIAATKASSKQATFYYQTSSACIQLASDPCDPGNNTQCYYSPTTSTSYPVYAHQTNPAVCNTPVLKP
jgi:hypothetical protein